MGSKRYAKKTSGPPRRALRGNPRLQEEIHDPYRGSAKLRTPRRCSQCGATYLKGRWTWERLQPPPAPAVCPACRRVNDHYPAGELTLAGSFFATHADEMVSLIRNTEKAEHGDHPLHRIMDLRRTPEGLVVTTTDIHLPRRIGHALEDAWGGTLQTHYDERGYFVRVHWERND